MNDPKIKSFSKITEERPNDRLSFVFNRMPQGLLFIDQAGIILLFNAAAEKMLNKKIGDALNMQFDEVFQNLDLGFTFADAIEGKAIPSPKDVVAAAQNGTPQERILEVDPKVIYAEGKTEPEGVIVLIRDITRDRQLERIAERKRSLLDLGELSSTIGHEIRNPLGGIKGFASLLQNDLKDDPQKLRMIQNIIRGVDELNRTLGQILEYSRPQPLDLQETDIKALIKDLVENVQADDSVKDKAKISFNAPRGSVTASVDSKHLSQALANVILNSAQAIEEQGSITISLTETDINIRIVIEDTGCGIEEKNLKKIFRPYFSTKAGAGGFGLAEAKKVIDAHNGKIDISSEEGKGAKFILTIPRLHEN
jgi:signal transduction histidine kinase